MENVRLTNGLTSTIIGLTGNLYELDPGDGLELMISNGVVTVANTTHAIDSEAAGTTDNLVTINGGMTGDVLTIYPANGTRTVIAKDGTGNLTLGGDRVLDVIGATLVLRKHADGKWHQIAFSSVT